MTPRTLPLKELIEVKYNEYGEPTEAVIVVPSSEKDYDILTLGTERNEKLSLRAREFMNNGGESYGK